MEIVFQTDTPGASTRTRIAFGEDPQNLAAETPTRVLGNWSGQPNVATITNRQRAITGLAPSTSYYFDIRVSNAAGSSFGNWDQCETQHCPSAGAQPGGYQCVQVGSRLRPRFTTLPANGTPPTSPNSPVNQPVLTDLPVVTGSTFLVNLDEEKRCTNFQQMLNAAAAADPGLVHQVVVPAGGVCRPESEDRRGYILGEKRGTGTVVVRCDADPKLLPPPGVRIDPAWQAGGMCNIEWNLGDNSADNTALIAVSPANCASQPCTEGWRFVGFRIGAPDFRLVTRKVWPVISFDSSNGKITVQGDIREKEVFDNLQVSLPGVAEVYAHRTCNVTSKTYNSSTDTSVVTLCGGGNAGGNYLGGGTLSDRIATPLATCAAGVDPICESAEPHLLSNYYEFPLLTISGDTATVNGSHQIDNFHGVRILGSTGGCDGFYTVTSVNKGAGTARLSPAPASPCTGGVMQEMGAITIFETAGRGASDANRVHLMNVIDATHFQLLGSVLSGSTIGGWSAIDPPLFETMVTLRSCRRCVFDRVLLDGGGPPIRSQGAFSWTQSTTPQTRYATQGAVINSWIQDFEAWFPTHPISGTAPRTTVYSVLSATPVIHGITATYDYQVLNVGHYAVPGISMFGQNGNQVCAEDISLERGFFYYPRSRVAGFPEAHGLYFPSRHFIEFKCVRRLGVRGLELRQNPANGQPSGAPIQLSTQNERSIELPGAAAQDVNLEFNLIWDNGGAIDMVGPGDTVSASESTRRIRIADNLVRTNRPVWNTMPSNQFGEIKEQWGNLPFYGEFFRDVTVSTDTIIERNTVGELLGSNAAFYQLEGQFAGTSTVRKNIFPFSNGQFRGIYTTDTGYLPSPLGTTGYKAWINHFRRGVGPDPFSVWDNVAVPCLDDAKLPFEAASKSTNNVNNTANSDFSCSGGCPSNFSTQIVGANGQNCRTRQALVFKERMDYGRPANPAYPGYGVDADQLWDKIGLVRDLKVEPGPVGTATFTYRAPDTAACWIDYGQDKLFPTSNFGRVSDGGGPVQRQVLLTQLLGSTTYHFRLLCPADQPRGFFVTLPGGST